jgi:hypothetical protein
MADEAPSTEAGGAPVDSRETGVPGERQGFLRRHWGKLLIVCKTWEGELQMSNIPGSAPILFEFSVRSDSLAGAIQAAEGRRVSLSYEQHIGVPTRCFGETEYFVVGVRELER